MQDHTDDDAVRRSCPPWCRRDHRPGLHPDDQHHAGPASRVAVVTGQPALHPDAHADTGAVVARLVRRTHSDQTWLEVVSEEGRAVRLVVTLDSARRLLATLHEVVSAASR